MEWRRISLVCVAGILLHGPSSLIGEAIPVDHREPITIRVLNGKNGRPIPGLHLLVKAGYDERDFKHRLWQDQALTDGHGEARLPQGLANFPFLGVVPLHAALCQPGSGKMRFMTGRIRSDGVSASNYCGFIQVPDVPGVLTIFAKRAGVQETVSPHAPSPTPPPVLLDFSGPGFSGLRELSGLAPEAFSLSTATGSNEIRSLLEHVEVPPPVSPAPISGAAPGLTGGTVGPADSYEEMCIPER